MYLSFLFPAHIILQEKHKARWWSKSAGSVSHPFCAQCVSIITWCFLSALLIQMLNIFHFLHANIVFSSADFMIITEARLSFISCAAYRGHRVRRDQGPQRHRCHPEAAEKTTKEEHTGWVLTSLVLQRQLSLKDRSLLFVISLLLFLTAQTKGFKYDLKTRPPLEQEVSHTCHSY